MSIKLKIIVKQKPNSNTLKRAINTTLTHLRYQLEQPSTSSEIKNNNSSLIIN